MPSSLVLYAGLGWAMLMCGSAAVVFSILVNQHNVPPGLAASWRLAWVEVLQVGPFLWQVREVGSKASNPWEVWRTYGRALPAVILSGICLGLHFSAWVLSIQMTSLAHSLLFVSMGPILLHGAAWVMWLLSLSHATAPSCKETVGVFLGLGGSFLLIWDVLITAHSSSSEASHAVAATWQGDLVALSGAATVSLYLTIGRHLRQWMPLWIYAFGVKGVAYLTSLAWALYCDPTLRWRDIFGFLFLPNIWLALYLGAGPGVCGHTLVNGLIKYLSPLTVSTAMLSEPLFGGWLGYLLGMQDMPGPLTWTGGTILLVSLFLILASETASESPSEETASDNEQRPFLGDRHATSISASHDDDLPKTSSSGKDTTTPVTLKNGERRNQSRLAKALFSTAIVFCLASLPACSSFSLPTTMSKAHVAVVGSVNYDLNSYTSQLPVLGETVMGESFKTSSGGKGANQAKAAASLGVVPVTMVSRVGSDVFGQDLLKAFDQKNVQYNIDDTILRDGTSSGVATIVVDNGSGDNMIIVTPGANYALTPENIDAELRKMMVPPAVVVVQLEIKYSAALQALKTAKELGAITILNPAPAPTKEGALDEFYPFVDLFIPNETELRTLCGKVGDDSVDEEGLAKSLLDMGVNQAVICTLGARGAMIVSKDDTGTEIQTSMICAPKDLPCNNEPVIDTIGAGDAFCGALSSYLASGLDLVEAGNLACGFASMSVRRRGANYPDPHELPEMLRPAALQSKEAPVVPSKDSAKPKLTFITGNSKKLEEVRQILSDDFPFHLVAEKVDLPELQGADPQEIAREKCRLAAQKVGSGPVFTEDTCLSFTALGGMPGPYIKWFLDKCGHVGLNRMLDGFDDRSAVASTVVAFSMGGGDDEIHVFEGQTHGTIVSARGSLDFGWDPVFQPNEGGGLTYAEMEKSAKNSISHRGRALAKFREFVQERSQAIN